MKIYQKKILKMRVLKNYWVGKEKELLYSK